MLLFQAAFITIPSLSTPKYYEISGLEEAGYGAAKIIRKDT
jgi:hypothetical protein